MELYFLGTGGGVPSKQRNVTSIALDMLPERGYIWLFDCGEGTQQQILHSPLKLSKIEKIFITHLHGDHIYGLPGLLSSRSFQEGEKGLTVYGPTGIREFVMTALNVSGTHLRYPLNIVEITPGVVFCDHHVTVSADILEHGITSYGYRISEHNRPGALDAERLQAEGIPAGPLYKHLKNGETVELDDGRLVDGTNYLGPTKIGQKVAIIGDSRPVTTAVTLADDVDVLVHEATFMEDNVDRAYRYYHTTARQAAEMASQAGVQTLLLTHISSRYQNSEAALEKEARGIFSSTYVAADFWRFSVTERHHS